MDEDLEFFKNMDEFKQTFELLDHKGTGTLKVE